MIVEEPKTRGFLKCNSYSHLTHSCWTKDNNQFHVDSHPSIESFYSCLNLVWELYFLEVANVLEIFEVFVLRPEETVVLCGCCIDDTVRHGQFVLFSHLR